MKKRVKVFRHCLGCGVSSGSFYWCDSCFDEYKNNFIESGQSFSTELSDDVSDPGLGGSERQESRP